MTTLDEKIDQAHRHVDSGKLIVERQRALILRHRTPDSIKLLELFKQTQRVFESDLADLLKRKQPYPQSKAPHSRE
ncbi:hypothetical protein JQ595_38600 [Bradyrhizobium japonicum]|uniref:hypothetical protein n=1 Tax=Bradyrhizobium japonicum TaxID=375 RepID=UPI001BAA09A0|nr:hypothetical protein [Bradyrhizobium japonicum]MBR0734671.1 hypothetical protein [Bradyrhizobium japonicum]